MNDAQYNSTLSNLILSISVFCHFKFLFSFMQLRHKVSNNITILPAVLCFLSNDSLGNIQL